MSQHVALIHKGGAFIIESLVNKIYASQAVMYIN